MPTTVVDIFPGSDFDFTFGSEATRGWSIEPTFSKVADGANDPVDPTFGRIAPSTVDPLVGYAEWKSATVPQGVSVSKLEMFCWILATGTSGEYDVSLAGVVRPSGTGNGSSGASVYGSPANLHSHSAALEVYEQIKIGEWATNPDTSLAWTIADLQTLAWGIKVDMPDVPGIGNAAIKLGRIFLRATVVTIDGNVEGVRVVGSSFLRFFGRPVQLVVLEGPAPLGDVDLYETFTLEHFLGPSPNAVGWGPEPWAREPLIPYEKSYDWINARVSLKCIAPRQRYCSWWSTFLTDLGHSPDGRGIPLLHSGGGGLQVTRDQVKYIERPGNPPDGILMAVPADRAAYSNFGLVVEAPGEENLVLNSTMSQGGPGDTFDDWTKGESGTGTVIEATGAVLQIDVEDLKRAAVVQVGGTDASEAYLYQTVSIDSDFRVEFRTINSVGTGKLAAIIRRASDSKEWNDETEDWETGPVYNRIGNPLAGARRWMSKLIPGSADTITILWGYFNEAGTANFAAYLCSARLVDNAPTHLGTDIITTTSTVVREADVVRIQNNEIGRVWRVDRGSFSFGFSPFWNDADLGSGDEKILLHVALNLGAESTGDYFRIFYKHDNSSMIFRVRANSTNFEAIRDLTGIEPTRGTLMKIDVRWTSTERELGKAAYTYEIAVDNVWGEPVTIDPDEDAVPAIEPTSLITVGSDAPSDFPEHNAHGWADGELRHFDFTPLVLTDEALQRRPN